MSSATASVSKFEIKHPPLFAHWCTNFVIYSNPQKTGVVNPLSEVQLSIMLNLLIILLATICVATGNLNSKQTGGQTTVRPQILKVQSLHQFTSLNQFCVQKTITNIFRQISARSSTVC